MGTLCSYVSPKDLCTYKYIIMLSCATQYHYIAFFFVTVMPFFPILFHRLKSVVKTSGALLDELQENGMDALKYKVILFLMKCMNDL